MATTVSASTLSDIPLEDNTFKALEAPTTHVKPKDDPDTINELIVRYSSILGVSEGVMRTVIKCESGYNPNAVGDGGYSYGLVQIHLPSWPSISKEQALSPEFAIKFLAEKLSKDQGYLWTCYRNLVK